MVDAMLDDDDERQLAAVRAFAFVLRHATTMAISVLSLAGIGLVLGLMVPELYESHAAIEIGLEVGVKPPPIHPLEMPIVTRERLAGILEKNRARYPGVAGFELDNRREPKARALTRVIDISVYATTASAATSILNASVAELLEEHRKMHAYEIELIARERQHYEHAQKRIEAALEALGGAAEEPVQVVPGDKKPQLLSGALLEMQRLTNTTNAMLSARRLPETLVVEPTTVPEPVASRLAILVISGALFGALLGVAIGLFRDIAAPKMGVERVRPIRAIEEADAHRAP